MRPSTLILLPRCIKLLPEFFTAKTQETPAIFFSHCNLHRDLPEFFYGKKKSGKKFYATGPWCAIVSSSSRLTLKPQDSFGEFDKKFLDLQKVQEIIIKHCQTFLQLFWMSYCNATLPSGKSSLCSLHNLHVWQSVRGDSEHFYFLVISWKWKHFGANC